MHFDPREHGARCWLGPLETDVMAIVWDAADAEVTVRKVWRTLFRGRDIAYTSVMCTMTRLARKGLLSRRQLGAAVKCNAYLYRATMTEDEFLEMQRAHVLAALDGVTV